MPRNVRPLQNSTRSTKTRPPRARSEEGKSSREKGPRFVVASSHSASAAPSAPARSASETEGVLSEAASRSTTGARSGGSVSFFRASFFRANFARADASAEDAPTGAAAAASWTTSRSSTSPRVLLTSTKFSSVSAELSATPEHGTQKRLPSSSRKSIAAVKLTGTGDTKVTSTGNDGRATPICVPSGYETRRSILFVSLGKRCDTRSFAYPRLTR